MTAYTLLTPLLFRVWLMLFLGIVTSCNTDYKGRQYSHYQVIGTSKLTVFIDSLEADRATTDNYFYMELMTQKDTFLVKPIEHELSFPKLEDSLTQVIVYYKDWHFQMDGDDLKREYEAFYFPNQPVTIVIDTYPYEHRSKKWVKEKKDRVYYEISYQKGRRSLITTMEQDKRSAKGLR